MPKVLCLLAMLARPVSACFLVLFCTKRLAFRVVLKEKVDKCPNNFNSS